MLKAQTASLPFGIVAIMEFIVFVSLWGFEPVKSAGTILLPWYFLPIFFAGIVVHEAIHAASWMLAAGLPFRKMKFGFQIKSFTPYAHCTVPISKRSYFFGTIMPAVLLGFLPFGISLANGSGWLLIVGVLFTFAAIGDFLILWLIRAVPWSTMVEDHPENAGCFVYSSEYNR